MENLILCLLMTKGMTIYEIKTYIERALNTVCSNSLGSIQVALKKLKQGNRVTVKEYEENGVIKKEYRITPDGVKQFVEWMQSPINLYKAKNMEEGKLFYLGMMPKDKQLKSLENLIKDMKKQQQSLQQVEAMVAGTKESVVEANVERLALDPELMNYMLSVSENKSISEVLQNIVDYQCYMLEYGLLTIENDLRFFTSVYNREKVKGGESEYDE